MLYRFICNILCSTHFKFKFDCYIKVEKKKTTNCQVCSQFQSQSLLLQALLHPSPLLRGLKKQIREKQCVVLPIFALVITVPHTLINSVCPSATPPFCNVISIYWLSKRNLKKDELFLSRGFRHFFEVCVFDLYILYRV